MEKFLIAVAAQNAGQRLDKFIAENVANISRSMAERLISDGKVSVNGAAAKKNYVLAYGDTVSAEPLPPRELSAEPQNIPVEIAYEDDALLVVNKPKGMVVHPAPGNPDGTLVNALLYHCKGRLSSINGVIRPGIVHRIDKDTSGLLIVAKTDGAHSGLAAQIEAHSFLREYECVIVGAPREDCGTIDKPIGRHPVDRKRMAVVSNGRHAVTHYEVITRYNGFTHVRCRLETGRTHQIRVHMSSIGHPLLGDLVYGYGQPRGMGGTNFPFLEGQCLHARRIAFEHPLTHERIDITSELPDYFNKVLEKLKYIT